MGKLFKNKFFHEATLLFAAGWFFVSVFSPFGFASATLADDQKNNLRQQIDEIQKQIDIYRANISDLQQQGGTLKREISLLDSKIKAAGLEIRRTALDIRAVEAGISDKNLALGQAELKLDRERQLLAEYVRAVYEADQQGTLEMILGNEKLSDIFDRASSLQNIQKGMQESMTAIQQSKITLENDRQILEDRRDEMNQLNVLQEIQRRALAAQQNDKKNLLAQTKGQESNYQALARKAKADAEAIRKNLYLLEGVGLSMTLEKAYQYAKQASNLTGIRPAFLLAVLKNESSWGEKVGTGTWRRDMHARDQQAFVQICDSLNLDPDKTPVSRKPAYGWGGAMGPAQFLPTVWLSYADKVAQLTGHNPPDPWNIEDAFVAASVKLTQAGAAAQTYNAEWKAAQIYFAGKRWNNPTYSFYGDKVMEMAGVIQDQLNIIAR
ncbi:MAG: lytic murein transglycosylase [Candidatus Portnoybacteria bacterium]|nr:lytic murein transglycosylase [Candidatus Portnoybacteria bacterium]MDD4982962.1 lytic murein transglycosylase [Candidatus Portnoybacteria bacterium]